MAHFDPDLPLGDESPGNGDDELRDQILDSARDDVPSAGSRDQLLAAFDLAPVNVGVNAGARPETGSMLRSRYAQIVGIALAIGAGAAAVSFGSAERPSSVAKTESVPATAPASRESYEPGAPRLAPEQAAEQAPRAAEPASANPGVHEVEPTSRARPPASPTVAAAAAKAAEDSKGSSLGREVARVTAARAALGGGDAACTLELLDAYDAEFPGGTLSVEASVLRIEALVRSGRTDEARRLGERFLARHPRGAFARRVETTLEPAASAPVGSASAP